MGILREAIENNKNRTTIADYIMDQLYNQDKAFAVRADLINGIKRQDEVYINLFITRHNIQSDIELDRWIMNAKGYILNIRKDIFIRLLKEEKSELIKIMNNNDYINEFIKKYIVKEEDLKHDSFFQCS